MATQANLEARARTVEQTHSPHKCGTSHHFHTKQSVWAACCCVQEQVKGSQGAGKVDEALDRGAKADKGDEGDKGKAGAKPQLPNRPAGKGKGGRR